MSKNEKKIDIFNKLRSSGLRPTKQRVEIAKYLFERENKDKNVKFIIIKIIKTDFAEVLFLKFFIFFSTNW